MDANGCRQAQHHIDEVIHNNHHKEVEINLQHVQFLDSSGIGAIVYLYKRLVERERSMSIENVSGQPLEIMSLLYQPCHSRQLKRTLKYRFKRRLAW